MSQPHAGEGRTERRSPSAPPSPTPHTLALQQGLAVLRITKLEISSHRSPPCPTIPVCVFMS